MYKMPFKQKLSPFRKTEIMLKLINGGNIEEIIQSLTAVQLQELRNFLEHQILHLSTATDDSPLTLAEIKANFEPIPNYYWSQDCREPLESCYNETCLASNPGCFSRKMKKQLLVLLTRLHPYLESHLSYKKT